MKTQVDYVIQNRDGSFASEAVNAWQVDRVSAAVGWPTAEQARQAMVGQFRNVVNYPTVVKRTIIVEPVGSVTQDPIRDTCPDCGAGRTLNGNCISGRH